MELGDKGIVVTGIHYDVNLMITNLILVVESRLVLSLLFYPEYFP